MLRKAKNECRGEKKEKEKRANVSDRNVIQTRSLSEEKQWDLPNCFFQ